MAKAKQRGMTLAGVIAVIAILALSFSVFQLSGEPAPASTSDEPVVQCDKNFEHEVSFTDRDAYDKGDDSGTVVYKVWKVEKSGNKIPQTDLSEPATLDMGFDETYEVVATQANATNEARQLSVDANCNPPEDQLFNIADVPTSIDATFENSKITGPNSESNKIPVPIGDTRTVSATFNGQSKTTAPALLVLEADKDLVESIDSDASDGSTPQAHTVSGVNQKTWAFEMGTLDQARDLVLNLDIKADDDASAQPVNVTYTIYVYQQGFINSDTGNFDNELAIEDNDDNVLLPTVSGTLFLDLQ